MKIVRIAICFLFLTSLISASVFANQFKVLLFTKSVAWHHKSVNEGVDAIKAIAFNHNFQVEWHEDANKFNPKNLEKYQAVIFLQTTGDVLNDKQQDALKAFIQSGKGYVGIHSASDTEYGWPWYGKLVGRRFIIHPKVQTGRMSVIDDNFPGLEYFPKSGLWTDEWYELTGELSPNLKYLLSVDESSYDPKVDWGNKKGKGMGEFHPVAWYQYIEGGRSFYTSLGHMPVTYSNKAFQEHIYGGIYWAATGKGMKK